MRRHAKAPSAVGSTSKRAASRKLLALAALTLLASLALGASLAGAVAPTVTVEDAANVEYTSADVKGTVDPGDHGTSYRFQYATEADFSNANSGGEGSLAENAGQQTVQAALTELSPDTIYHLRLVAENESGSSEAVAASTFTTKAVAAPTVSIDPVTAFTGTTAHFSGTINPNAPGGNPSAFNVNWHFQCTPFCPGLSGGQISADSSSHVVEVDAEGLEPSTSYEVTLVASNVGGQSLAGPTTLQTPATAPAVIDLPAGPTTETTAVIGGQVDPNNAPTTYYLEYSAQADFSDAVNVPASQDADAGSGGQPVSVSHLATGLTPNTTYFFRLVADNPTGPPTVGVSHSFRTLTPEAQPSCPNAEFRIGASASLPDCRAYEKVTPQEKNNNDVLSGALVDENHVFMSSNGPMTTNPRANLGINTSLATRTQNGWGLLDLSPAYRAQISPSGDFSRAVTFGTRQQLAPEDTDHEDDIYRLDHLGDFNFHWISRGSLGGNSGGRTFFAGQSVDGSHIAFETAESLEPADANRTSGLQLYERVGGETRVVGVDSSGAAFPGGAVLADGPASPDSGTANAISTDGSRLFFESPDPALGLDTQLYVRLGGSDTVEVSASQCHRTAPAPPCVTGGSATFQGADAAGTKVLFTSNAQLLDEDVDSSKDLYLYDVSTGSLQRLTDFSTPGGVIGVTAISQNLGRVYFVASGVTHGVGDSGHEALLFHDVATGQTHTVASLDVNDGSWPIFSGASGGEAYAADATSDGNVLAFASHFQLTSFDNHGLVEVYRYQADDNSLECVSCNLRGIAPLHPQEPQQGVDGNAADLWPRLLGRTLAGTTGSHQAPVLSDDGRTVIFRSFDPLLDQDTNRKWDVYRWHDGRVALISAGASPTDSTFAGISPSGTDIFLISSDQLVGADQDHHADLYDARVDGGLVLTPPPSPCSGEACRGISTPPVTAPDPGSSSFSGAGNPAPRHAKVPKRHKRHKKKRHHGRASRANSISGGVK